MEKIDKAISILEKKFAETRDNGKVTVLTYTEFRYICTTLDTCNVLLSAYLDDEEV